METKRQTVETIVQKSLVAEERAGEIIGGAERPISKRTLQSWRLRGVGPPYIKCGRSVRYDVTELYRWLESRKCTSTSEVK